MYLIERIKEIGGRKNNVYVQCFDKKKNACDLQ